MSSSIRSGCCTFTGRAPRSTCATFIRRPLPTPLLPSTEKRARRWSSGFWIFCKTIFFAVPGSLYAVLEEDGSWVSALRLAPVEGGWYLEALETDPDFRRRGCAKRLIRQVIAKLEEDGPVTIWDSVAKTNAASLATHSSCGFVIVRDEGYSYRTGETYQNDWGLRYRTPSESR